MATKESLIGFLDEYGFEMTETMIERSKLCNNN